MTGILKHTATFPWGKGEPPAAYIERRAEKGAKGTGRGRIPHSKSEEKGKSRFGGAAGSGSQGAAGSGSQGAAGSGSQGAAGSGSQGAAGSGSQGAVGKGQGGAVGNGSRGGVAGNSQQAEGEGGPPQVRSCGGGKGPNDRGPVYITQWGTKYHTHEGCFNVEEDEEPPNFPMV